MEPGRDRSPCRRGGIPPVRASRVAGDGRQALTVLAESDGGIHLVLADMLMPEMDGLELRRHLRAHYPRLPVLLMSGYSEEAITHLGHEPLGPVLEKPFTLEGLLAKVEEMLTSEPGAA